MLETLPARWYADADRLEVEQERIFRRSWQYAVAAAAVAEPGSFFAMQAGPVPLVVVRDREGTLRAHVNVCRHRGHLVAEGSGRCTTLQCPYHAWTYDLDGTLRQAPRSEEVETEGLGLLPAAVDTWGPFVFVHPDPKAPPLADHLGDLPDVVARTGLDLGRLELDSHTEWGLACNWKVAVENYLECYHCQVNHPGLAELVDVRAETYALEQRESFSFQVGPSRNVPGSFTTGGEVPHAQWHWLWPNVAINVEPGPANLSIDVWEPDGAGRTKGRTDYFFGPEVPAAQREEILEFSRQLGVEDQRLVESVQKGLASGAIESGRLLPRSERLIAHFQQLVRDATA
jgi:choline monooxygenase